MAGWKRLIRTATSVVPVLVLASIISLSVGLQKVSALNFAVSGTITDASTSLGVGGATITAYTPGTATVRFSATSAANGTYNLTVTDGTYDFRFAPSTGGLTPVVDKNVTIAGNTVINKQLTNLRYTFSGTLTDQNGVGLNGANVTVTDLYHASFTGSTSGGGNFSISVYPGMYSLTLASSSNVGGIASFTLQQNSLTPSLDVSAGNLVRNLQMQIATVNYTAYNAQGYPNTFKRVQAQTSNQFFSGISLYPGDSGYTATLNAGSLSSDGQGKGTFKTLVGASYSGSGLTNGVCDLDGVFNLIGCNTTPLSIVNGTNTVDVPHAPATPSIFSGVLTDQNGTAIPNASINLRDAFNNNVFSSTNASGAFSVSVQPGTYSLSVTGNISGLGAFTLTQSPTTPSINLTNSVTQNLQLQIVTVNYTAYNAQSYPNANRRILAQVSTSQIMPISLYPGDPGYSVSLSPNSLASDGFGKGSFKSIVGVIYAGTGSGNGICPLDSSFSVIGCNNTPYTVVSGFNYLDTPKTPPAPNLFSGTLTDQNGTPLNNINISLNDAFGNGVSGMTNTSGAFSIPVEPGMYRMSLSGGIPGIQNFSLTQGTTSFPLDLTSANLTKNLQLQTATVNFTAYNAQGYPNIGKRVVPQIGSSSVVMPISLYPGDTGYLVTSMYAGTTTSDNQGKGSFKSIVGAIYLGTGLSNGICPLDSSFTLIGCNTTPFTVTSGFNYLDTPKTPAAPYTYSGILTDQNNTPLANVSVSLMDSYGNVVANSTTATGAFNIAVQPGMYSLTIVCGSLASGISSLQLRQNSTTPTINLTSGNVTQNLQLQMATVNVTTDTTALAPMPFARVNANYNSGSATVASLYPGDPGEIINITSASITSNSQAIATFKSIVGIVYAATQTNGLCESTNAGVFVACVATPYTVVSGINNVVIPQAPAGPAAPTGLAAPSPTSAPALTWQAVVGASYYRIYRDGVQIATSSTTTYTDNSSASATYSYYVTAVNSAGGTSSPSASISVTVVLSPPTLSSTFSILPSPIDSSQTATITVQVIGNLSGFLGGEYFVGTDPGQGNGIAMTFSNGTLTAPIGGLLPGLYTVSVRAQNTVGWSDVVSRTLNVNTLAPANLYADSPTHMVVLTWSAVAYASSYDVYRNNIKIATSTTNSYTDVSAPIATNTYYVRALNSAGSSSNASNTISVAYTGPLYTVSGQVFFDGTAASGVLVDINQVDGPSGFSVTDGSGTYDVFNLDNGNYSVTVSNPLNGNVSAAYAPNKFTLTSGFPFVVVNGGNVTQGLAFGTNAVTITVKNGQGALMNGSLVTMVNVTNGLIYSLNDNQVFNLDNGKLVDTGFTGANGTVTMYAFPGVTYQICASFPQLNTMSHSDPYCMLTTLAVTGDTSYEADLPNSYTASGHISFDGSSPSTGGAKVSLASTDGKVQQVVLSDSSGNYSIAYLPDGVYDLALVNNNNSNDVHVPQSWHFTKNSAITVSGANVTQNLEFATNLVDVTVVDGTGALIPSALVTMKSKSANPIQTLDGTQTFAFATDTTVAFGTTVNGQKTLGVFTGQLYQVCAQISTGTYCRPDYLEVDADTSVIVVAADTYTVSGTVLINGSAIPQVGAEPSGANVSLHGVYAESANTDTNGVYAIDNLINGAYTTTIRYTNSNQSSAVTGVPNDFTLTSVTPDVTVSGGNAVYNASFTTTPVVVYVYDPLGNLLIGSQLTASSTTSGQVSTTDALRTFNLNFAQAGATSLADGSPVFYLFPGITYTICAAVNSGQYCARGIVVSSNTTTVVSIFTAAPTGLHALLITPYPQDPVLGWNAISTAVSYNIYRNDVLVGSSNTNSFTDLGAPEGVYSYYVTAVYPGSVESVSSLPVPVIVDKTKPAVTSSSWVNNPSLFGNTISTLTANLVDSLTNIIAGEYYIGDVDPGLASGIAMGVSDSSISASFGWASYPPGTYVVNFRGKNAAGIWSDTVATTLVVELPAPQNVTATSPTYVPPVISWSAVNGAQYYTIYRNGDDVGTSSTTSYTDTGAAAGNNTYSVVAVSFLGVQSAHSNSIVVLYDPNPPVITPHYVPNPINGWNNSPLTVSFTCTATYGVNTCPQDVIFDHDGANQQVTVTATDNLGGSSSLTVTVSVDQAPPTVGIPSLSINPIYYGQTTDLTASASDNLLSGVAGGEYFIGVDPGAGNGVSMTWDGTNLTATLGSTLPAGTYTINVRAVDVAGNWGEAKAVTLTIILGAPTDLTAVSPAQEPALSWAGSQGAVSYNIYRNGSLVGNSATTNYTDTTAPDGINSYFVTAVNASNQESQPSNTIQVLVNTVPPTTTASLSPSPYVQDGTYPDPVTVTLSASAVSGLSVTATYYTVDGGAQQAYSAPFTVSGTGSHTITYWSVDNAGVVEAAKTTTFTIHTNIAPAINSIAGATINEGSSFTRSGSFGDFDSTSWTAAVNYGDGSGVQPLTLTGTNFLLSHVYADDGIYTVTVVITDNQGASSTATATVTVNNVAPTAGEITGLTIDPIQLNPTTNIAAVSASISFADLGVLDTHTAVWDWGDGTTSTGVVTESNGAGTVSGSHNYTATGIYTVTVTITDNGGLSAIKQFLSVNVYDASSKFVAGVKFNSPAGAYVANPNVTGSVDFHVNVKYNASGQLTGVVSMTFAAGGIDFEATGYVMLVCTDLGRATLTGSGTFNGQSGYTFWITGIDKNEAGGNKIRFRIMDSNGNVVYDTNVPAANQPYDPITADPTTSVTAGVIIVQ